MDQKGTFFQGDDKQDFKFNETVLKLKKKVENINNYTVSHLKNLQGN